MVLVVLARVDFIELAAVLASGHQVPGVDGLCQFLLDLLACLAGLRHLGRIQVGLQWLCRNKRNG